MYFITALKKDSYFQSRTFGFAETFEKAHEYVTDNVGSMDECYYDCIVIEKIEPGIPASVIEEHWYEWCSPLNCWQPTSKPPECLLGVVNFAIG
jgi:hypothetical protein